MTEHLMSHLLTVCYLSPECSLAKISCQGDLFWNKGWHNCCRRCCMYGQFFLLSQVYRPATGFNAMELMKANAQEIWFVSSMCAIFLVRPRNMGPSMILSEDFLSLQQWPTCQHWSWSEPHSTGKVLTPWLCLKSKLGVMLRCFAETLRWCFVQENCLRYQSCMGSTTVQLLLSLMRTCIVSHTTAWASTTWKYGMESLLACLQGEGRRLIHPAMLSHSQDDWGGLHSLLQFCCIFHPGVLPCLPVGSLFLLLHGQVHHNLHWHRPGLPGCGSFAHHGNCKFGGFLPRQECQCAPKVCSADVTGLAIALPDSIFKCLDRLCSPRAHALPLSHEGGLPFLTTFHCCFRCLIHWDLCRRSIQLT